MGGRPAPSHPGHKVLGAGLRFSEPWPPHPECGDLILSFQKAPIRWDEMCSAFGSGPGTKVFNVLSALLLLTPTPQIRTDAVLRGKVISGVRKNCLLEKGFCWNLM